MSTTEERGVPSPVSIAPKLMILVHPVPFVLGGEEYPPISDVMFLHPSSVISCYNLPEQGVWVVEQLNGNMVGLSQEEFLHNHQSWI